MEISTRWMFYIAEILIVFTSLCQSYELTEEDLNQLFGDRRPTEYSIFQPKINGRSKRDLGQNSSMFEFNALGQNFKFRLTRMNSIFSPDFVLLSHDGSEATLLDIDLDSCVFQGQDERDRSKTIALVTCGNLRGVVKSPTEEFVIEPLPESIRRRSNRRRRRYERSTSGFIADHIIYKRKQYNGCSLDENRFDREYLHSRYSSFTNRYLSSDKSRYRSTVSDRKFESNDARNSGETYFIETSVFVDKDLLKHMQTNFPTNTEHEVIQVALAMVNAVQLLYNDPSLGYKVNYVLKRLELLYEDPRGLTRPHDIDDFLTKFCSWQHLENPSSDADPFHWDHALILTGLDLYTTVEGGRMNSQVVGLAPVAGMCTRTSSCTVNEGRHFESVYVVAHEIGHNLGMRHDGIQSGNNCDPSGYLMSPTLGSGKVTWSHCSKRYLAKFLDKPQAKCLRDKPQSPMKHLNHEGRFLPGERFGADQQCLLKYGIGSRSSTNQNQDEICRDLHCIRDHYTWTSHPALEGTKCGINMWCNRGICASRPRYQENYSDASGSSLYEVRPEPYESTVATTTEWGKWSNCRSPCLYGMDGVLSSGSTGLSTSERQCHSCKDERRYLSCSGVRECSIRRKRTLQDYADEICQRLSIREPDLSRYGDRLPLSGIRSCQIQCLSNSGIRRPRSFFPDGTVCVTAATSYPTFCISGYCTEFRCESTSLYGAGPSVCRSSSIPSSASEVIGAHQIPYGMSVDAFASPTSVISEPIWSPWLTSSSCRFSCLSPSRGIRLVSRTCLDPRGCHGLTRNIQLCSPEQSECNSVESPFTYASKVCKTYSKSVEQLSGIGMQLTSIPEDPDRGCTVACQDFSIKYRFYKVNGRDGWFPFGTECSSSGDPYDAYCLNGKCVEFNSDGTPLRNNGGSRDRSDRSLTLVAYNSHVPSFTSIMDQNVQGSHWREKRHIDGPSDSDPKALKRTKRKVKSTSYRIPGSFDDSFLHSLIDAINATFMVNESRRSVMSESSIDFDNPLFLNAGGDQHHHEYEDFELTLPSSIVEVKAAPLYKKSEMSITKIVGWKLKTSSCSVTCGEGFIQEIWNCMDEEEEIVKSSYCSQRPRPPDIHRPCTMEKKCSKLSIENEIPVSPFGRWLIDLVKHIKEDH